MAIYIQMRKTEEDASGAVYEFGPIEEMIGSVFISRELREVSLLHIDDPKKSGFYLPRVTRALQKEKGEFPSSAVYAA